jgi:hypothetical protein
VIRPEANAIMLQERPERAPHCVAEWSLLSIEAGSIEEILNQPRKPKKVIEAKFIDSFGAGTTYEEEIAMMERRLDVAEESPLNFLNVTDVKILPFSIGIYFWGYILTPSLDAPLDNSVVWLTRGHGYEKNNFYNSEDFLDGYWKSMELKALADRSYCLR